MKLGDAEYVAKVQALLNDGTCVSHSQARRRIAQTESGHKVTTMTEAETQAEIERIQDGAKSSFEGESSISVDGKILVRVDDIAGLPTFSEPKKRRGRPPGSRNKPKVNQGEVK